jgi:hypothetical protein
VHFTLPEVLADPNSAEAQPRVSATILVLVGVPKEMNFPVNVSRVRANADVFYHGKKLGKLEQNKWQHANSTRVQAKGNKEAVLKVQSLMKDVPLYVTDDDLFTEVVQELLFGGKGVVLDIKADVDVHVDTVLGEFVIKEIPAEGKVPVKR